MNARMIFLTVAATVVLLAPVSASAQFDAGFVLWKHHADLQVNNATDFDGSNETAEERGRNWDTQGSGFGVEAAYKFPRILRVYGELALAQSILRFEDISDPNRDVRTLAMDNTAYFAIGARPEGTFPNSADFFWSGGVEFSLMNSGLDQDIVQKWDYDETALSIDGRVGYLYNNIGFFGGLRLVRYNADLVETDLANAPGQQTRKIDFKRDNIADFLLGIQTSGASFSGSVEFGFLGSLSARAGIGRSF